MRLEILLTAILFFGGTLLAGYAIRRIFKLKKEGIFFSIVSGTVFWWALMELILVPMTMKMCSFQSFVYVYSIIILAGAIAGVCCWKDILGDITYQFKEVQHGLTLGHLLAFVLICYQLYFIHHHMYLEWDDTYYVNLANEAVCSNKIYWVYPETGAFADFDKRYVLSLWPIFYAWLSQIIGVMPTVMAHTILPWIIIPLVYMIYVLIGRRLFPEDRQLQGMFLFFSVLLHLVMSGEHTAGLTFLSITPWVGKGILATVLIPLLFYWIIRITQENCFFNWVMLGITNMGGCLLSSMGIMLTPVFVGMIVLLIVLYKRKFMYLLYGTVSCLPCIILGIYYIYLIR